VTSTTFELPIYLLNQSLETHEVTSQNEQKLKVSAKSKKNLRKSKKKPPTFELSTESTQSTRRPLSVPDTKSENSNNRRRRSSDSKNSPTHYQPSNYRTKANKPSNHHKESEKEVLVNNILISGIALHGVYFGACILLMIGISKVQN